jgi:hypothetical protein
MLSDEARASIGALIYLTSLEKIPNNAIDRALTRVVYDPLSRVTPAERLAHVREALDCSLNLSQVGPPVPHSNDSLRAYLAELARRIEQNAKKFAIVIDPAKKLPTNVENDVIKLLGPLVAAKNPNDALDLLIDEIVSQWDYIKDFYDAEQLIRFALNSNVALSSLVQTPHSEDQVRCYLRNAAWRIKDARMAKRMSLRGNGL